LLPKLGGKIGATLWGLVKSEVSAQKELSGSGTITPILKAILIENEAENADRLFNLASDLLWDARLREALLLRYVGNSRIISKLNEVQAEDEIGLSNARAGNSGRAHETEERLGSRNDGVVELLGRSAGVGCGMLLRVCRKGCFGFLSRTSLRYPGTP
jgi:hypothetical protein